MSVPALIALFFAVLPLASHDALQITYDLRLVACPKGTMPQGCPTKEGAVQFLNETQLKGVTDSLSKGRADIMQAPRVTAFQDQEAEVKVIDEQFFVTGIEAVRLRGEVVFVGKTTNVELGTWLKVRGRVEADNSTISLDVAHRDKRVDGKVELVPLVTRTTPIREDGSRGAVQPFTQHLQVPKFQTVNVEKTNLRVVSGASAVIAGPTVLREVQVRWGVPGLQELPVVGALFSGERTVPQKQQILLIVSPRIVFPPK